MPFVIGPNTLGTSTFSDGASFYKYEPFSFLFTNGTNFSVSGSLVAFCTTTTSNMRFAASNGTQSIGSSLGDTLTVTSSTTTATYTLFLKAGRFVTPTTSLVLYRNPLAPVNQTFTSTPSLTSAVVTPTLPAGLSFTGGGSSWTLSGYPTTVTPTSNYVFSGSNATQNVFTALSIQVLDEQFTMVPTQISTSLTINPATPITTITLSNDTYPSTVSSVTYNLQPLPAGLNYYSSIDNTQVSGQYVTPVTKGVYITGTPILSSAVVANSPNVSVKVTTTGIGASTLIASSILNFTYTPTVIWTAPALSSSNVGLYLNVPMTPVQCYANTAFTSSPSIMTYTAANLPPGLTITSSGLLSGTPTSLGTTSATLTATGGGISGSNVYTLLVNPVTIQITPSVTTQQSYIVGKPITPVTFSVTCPAYSGSSWVKSATLSLSNGFILSSNGTTFTVSGTPTLSTVTPLGITGTMTFNVTSVEGTTASSSVPYTVSSDTITFYTTSVTPFVFTQNVAISPAQFFTTTNSGTTYSLFTPLSYSSLPKGLYITSSGSLQGTPLISGSGYISMNMTNGYTTATPSTGQFPYTVLPAPIFITNSARSVSIVGSSVSIPLTITPAITSVSTKSYLAGLTITSKPPFVLSGTISPIIALPSSTRFALACSTAVAGTTTTTSTTQLELLTSNIPTVTRYITETTGSGYILCVSTNSYVYTPMRTMTSSFMRFDMINSVFVDGSGTIYGTAMVPDNSAQFAQLAYIGSNLYAADISGRSSGFIRIFNVTKGISYTNITYPGGTSFTTFVMRAASATLLIGGSGGIYAYTPNSIGSGTGVSATCALTNVCAISTDSSPCIALGTGGIQYSTDTGVTWSNAVNGFDISGSNIAYANNAWVATGSNVSGPAILWSSNGINWNPALSFTAGTTMGPVSFDGTYWTVFVNNTTIWQHDILTGMMSDSTTWFSNTATFPSTPTGLYAIPAATITTNGTSTYSLNIGVTSVGPSFSSPTITNYSLYQYVPITITFDAGVGALYYVDTGALPPGMTWTNNIPTGVSNYYTATITGFSVKLGTFSIDVFANSSVGTTKLTITIMVSRMFPKTSHPTISDYTAFTREKVVADSATSSVNYHTTPYSVGTFLLDPPPAITTAPEPCCDTATVKNIK